jgi:hypothetical protein
MLVIIHNLRLSYEILFLIFILLNWNILVVMISWIVRNSIDLLLGTLLIIGLDSKAIIHMLLSMSNWMCTLLLIKSPNDRVIELDGGGCLLMRHKSTLDTKGLLWVEVTNQVGYLFLRSEHVVLYLVFIFHLRISSFSFLF